MIGKLIDHGRKPTFGHGYSCHVCLLRPKSRGSLTLASGDPLAAPLIDPNFLGERDDVDRLMRGFKLMRRILGQPALAGHGRELPASAGAQTDAQIEQFIRDHADTIYHPVGTCRMGPGATDVVDAKLRVRGVQGLRVVDASIMPSIVGGNTNAPVIAIAEKAADLIKAAAGAASPFSGEGGRNPRPEPHPPHENQSRRRLESGAPLTIETVDLEGPRAGEVLVEVKATGICHTDYYTLSGADPEGLFPAILGHEGAGIVVDVGPGVTSLQEGRPRHPALHARMPPVQVLPVAQDQPVPADPRHAGQGPDARRHQPLQPGRQAHLPLHGHQHLQQLHRRARDRGREGPRRTRRSTRSATSAAA